MNRYLITAIVSISASVLLMSVNKQQIGLLCVNDQFEICNYQFLKDKKMVKDSLNMIITRVFNATPQEVWKAWSTEELVKQWWGPKGFSCPLARMDFKEGGISLVCMRAPKEYGGQDIYNTWSYQKIVPFERIEYVLNFSDKDGNKSDPALMGMPPGIPKDVPHVIIFKDMGNNKTEVTVTEYGYTSSQVVELSRSGMDECLDKMAEMFMKKQ